MKELISDFFVFVFIIFAIVTLFFNRIGKKVMLRNRKMKKNFLKMKSREEISRKSCLKIPGYYEEVGKKKENNNQIDLTRAFW